MHDTSNITTLAASVNVSANKFTTTANLALNVKRLGHKPTDEETAKAQSKSKKTNKIENLKTFTFNSISEFAQFLDEGNTLYTGTFPESIISTAAKYLSCSYIIAFDFDFPSILMEEILNHEFVQKYGAIIQPSYSAVEGNIYKFHLYFVTDRPIQPFEYRPLWVSLSKKFGVKLDESKKGANNLFFGSLHAPIIIDDQNRLPVDALLAEAKTNKYVKESKVKNISVTNGYSNSSEYNFLSFHSREPEEGITTHNLRHIWEKLLEKYAGDVIEAAKALYLDKLYKLNLRIATISDDEKSLGVVMKLAGCNPFHPSTTGEGNSFVLSFFDNGLPPVFYDRSCSFKEFKGGKERNGGSIISYWKSKEINGDLYSDIEGGKEYNQMIHALCDELKIERFNFKTGKANDFEVLYRKYQKVFGDKLRFNEMSLKAEIEEKEIKFDVLNASLALEHNIVGKKEKIKETFLYYAYQRTFHPVRDYLNAVAEKCPIDTLPEGIIDSLSTKYFGTSEPIFDIYVKKMLIGAVARIFEPGCKLKTVLVLHGAQDAGKSFWFEKLAGSWFNDNMNVGENFDKDDKMLLRRFWIHEIDEIDKAFKKADSSALKSVISRVSDNYRKPYGADLEAYPRMSIFVGTTNEDKLLHDSTGSVRFWVIPVKNKHINFEAVEAERDLLWAAAVHAYRAGIKWWLEGEENQIRDEKNDQFTSTDSWDESVLGFAEQYQELSVSMILAGGLELSKDRHDRRSQLRVEDILRRAKWISPSGNQRKICGTPFRLWTNPSPDFEKLKTAKDALRICRSLLVNGTNDPTAGF